MWRPKRIYLRPGKNLLMYVIENPETGERRGFRFMYLISSSSPKEMFRQLCLPDHSSYDYDKRGAKP